MGRGDDDVRERLLAFADRTVDFVGVSDAEGRVLYLNEAARKRLGIGDPDGLTTADLFPPEAFARYYDEVRPALLRAGAWNGTMPVKTATGESVPMLMSAVAGVGPGGEITFLVTHARDFPAARASGLPAELGGDALTGLLDASAFRARVASALAAAAPHGRRVALLRASVEGMRDINAGFGSDIGENVLRVLAYRMTQIARATDTVARIADDEFAVLFVPVRDEGEALRLAEGVRATMEGMPVATAAGEIAVSVALGIAVDRPSDTTDLLLGHAAARRVTRTVKQRSAPADLSELRLALSHGDVQPYVQPVVDLRTGQIIGYQGLARWHRPDSSVVEVEPLIGSTASDQIAPVVDLRVARDTVAVVTLMSRNSNLLAYLRASEPLLWDVRIEQYLWEIADAYGLAALRLHVQIAHEDVARPSPATRSVLRRLAEVGVRLVATDVGQDADVQRLAQLGFHELHLAARDTMQALAATALGPLQDTIRSSHDLGLRVGVVGIESEQQRAWWLEAQCDVGTGPVFGWPVPAESVE